MEEKSKRKKKKGQIIFQRVSSLNPIKQRGKKSKN